MISGSSYQNVTAHLVKPSNPAGYETLTLGLRDLLYSVTCTVRKNLIWDSERDIPNYDTA